MTGFGLIECIASGWFGQMSKRQTQEKRPLLLLQIACNPRLHIASGFGVDTPENDFSIFDLSPSHCN
jgi:hypothetical protein